MRLKDLLFNREKLRKFDELREWSNYFSKEEIYLHSACATFGADGKLAVFIPDDIRKIILSALDAEIKKLDEE